MEMAIMEPTERWVTISQAAVMIGVTEGMVQHYARNGRLKKEYIGHAVFLDRAEVQKFADDRAAARRARDKGASDDGDE